MTDSKSPESGKEKVRGGRSGGRGARRAERLDTAAPQLPYIRRNIPKFEILNDEAMDIIEANSDRVLEEVGIDFPDNPDALKLWKDAGADIKGHRVHFPKGLCRELMKTIPPTFTQHARNPERSVEIGGNNTVFAPVYGPPFVRDLTNERRYATIEDFQNFVKMIYMAPALHHSGGTVCEPVDVPVNKRHLDMLLAHMTLSDKPYMGSVTAPERAADSVEMSRRLFGSEFVDNNCVMVSLINANSPLVMDDVMMGALKVYAEAGQASIVSPFIVAGAMSPVTVAGTLTQIITEAQAALAYTQLCRAGSPVIFGTFGSSISMQSGAPAFGTPEPAQVLFGAAQFARRYNIPFRSGGSLTGSKLPDAQAAYESANTIGPTLLAGVNFVLHAAGWLEGGLVSSYAKFVMDADQLAGQQKMAAGVDISPEAQAIDAIIEVGPGSHYLGCEHTQANFKTAFFRSELADNNSFEQWEVEGCLSSADRANELASKWLKQYDDVAPTIDPAIKESLDEFVAHKKESMPDAFT